jgi:antirestriction protein ArdC
LWLKVLKDDKRAVFTAPSQAQKAADFLSGMQKPQDAAQAA